MRFLISTVIVIAIAACSKKDANPPPSEDTSAPQGKGVRVADFDRSCVSDADCIVVAEGTACCLGCPSASIAKKAFASYNTKLAEHRASCKQTSCPKADCISLRARCTGGTCEACKLADCPAPPADAGVDSGPAPDGKLIEVTGAGFSPDTVEIKVGDTVTWVFYEDGHSVVSGAGCTDDGKFGSGPKTNGAAFSFEFASAGEYAFHCEAHCAKPEAGIVHVK